jgi:putative protein-disulfide isomerase
MVKIHYFYDPMCGWCYGATALIEAIHDAEGFELVYHPGGMISRQAIAQSFRQHIIRSDEIIEAKTGELFGVAYKARVASNVELVFDSYLATRAILVAEEMGLDAFMMLKAIQSAHYQQGRQLELMDTLKELAVEYGFDEKVWAEKMQQFESKVDSVIQDSQNLMRQLQVNGFPTLLAEVNGEWVRLPHDSYSQKLP